MPKFDPMTGELITEETDGKGTASISENQTDIGQTTEQTGKQFVPRFDPMTGQPIHIEQSQPQTQSQFQRQLQSESQSQSQPQFQPQSQFQPRPQSQEPKKSHKMAIIVSIIAGVVVLLGILAFVLAAVLLSNPRTAVEKACAKTFSEGGYLYDTCRDFQGFEKDYTVTSNIKIAMQSEYSDGSIILYTQLGVDGKDKQLAGTMAYNSAWINIPEIEYKLQIDANEVRLQIPSVDSHVFTYNYTEEKHGYLTEIASAEDLQAIDDVLKMIYSSESSGDIKNTESAVKLMNWYRSLKVEKSDAGQFEVDGNIRKCKGYAILVTREDMNRFREIYQEYVETAMTDRLHALGMSAEEYTEQIFADIQDIEDATIRFYVYQKELACVELEAAGDIYQVIFHGGDYRTQNMEILVNGAVVCTIEGTLAGDEESITVDLSGNHVEVTYNRSTEAYDIKSENTYEKIEMNGSLSVGSKEIRLTVDQFALEGEADYTLSGDIAVTKGAVIDTMKGEAFDIGNASEEEYDELFDDLNQLLYGLLGY